MAGRKRPSRTRRALIVASFIGRPRTMIGHAVAVGFTCACQLVIEGQTRTLLAISRDAGLTTRAAKIITDWMLESLETSEGEQDMDHAQMLRALKRLAAES